MAAYACEHLLRAPFETSGAETPEEVAQCSGLAARLAPAGARTRQPRPGTRTETETEGGGGRPPTGRLRLLPEADLMAFDVRNIVRAAEEEAKRELNDLRAALWRGLVRDAAPADEVRGVLRDFDAFTGAMDTLVAGTLAGSASGGLRAMADAREALETLPLRLSAMRLRLAMSGHGERGLEAVAAARNFHRLEDDAAFAEHLADLLVIMAESEGELTDHGALWESVGAAVVDAFGDAGAPPVASAGQLFAAVGGRLKGRRARRRPADQTALERCIHALDAIADEEKGPLAAAQDETAGEAAGVGPAPGADTGGDRARELGIWRGVLRAVRQRVHAMAARGAVGVACGTVQILVGGIACAALGVAAYRGLRSVASADAVITREMARAEKALGEARELQTDAQAHAAALGKHIEGARAAVEKVRADTATLDADGMLAYLVNPANAELLAAAGGPAGAEASETVMAIKGASLNLVRTLVNDRDGIYRGYQGPADVIADLRRAEAITAPDAAAVTGDDIAFLATFVRTTRERCARVLADTTADLVGRAPADAAAVHDAAEQASLQLALALGSLGSLNAGVQDIGATLGDMGEALAGAAGAAEELKRVYEVAPVATWLESMLLRSAGNGALAQVAINAVLDKLAAVERFLRHDQFRGLIERGFGGGAGLADVLKSLGSITASLGSVLLFHGSVLGWLARYGFKAFGITLRVGATVEGLFERTLEAVLERLAVSEARRAGTAAARLAQQWGGVRPVARYTLEAVYAVSHMLTEGMLGFADVFDSLHGVAGTCSTTYSVAMSVGGLLHRLLTGALTVAQALTAVGAGTWVVVAVAGVGLALDASRGFPLGRRVTRLVVRGYPHLSVVAALAPVAITAVKYWAVGEGDSSYIALAADRALPFAVHLSQLTTRVDRLVGGYSPVMANINSLTQLVAKTLPPRAV